jgi:hypothetical protein
MMTESIKNCGPLTAGEFEKGMLVTVLEWKVQQSPMVAAILTGSSKDTRLVGHLLRIEAISLPFLACRHRAGHMVSIDTRDASISELSAEYIIAMGYEFKEEKKDEQS